MSGDRTGGGAAVRFAHYRNSRPPDFRPEFDRQAQRCRYILTLDGRYEKPAPDTLRAKNRRTAGYRAQSAVLLRHGDVLVAAANPDTNPDTSSSSDTGHQPADSETTRLLREYFDEPQTPPCKRTREGSTQRQPSMRERFWTYFEKKLRTGRSPKSDPPLPPYQLW